MDNMPRAALIMIARRRKQLKCSSAHEQIHKMWYIPMVEYYSVLKRNKVVIQATVRMNLENTALRARSK